MTAPTAVAIFAKTPGLSSCKTRLAASIGAEKAEAFYGLCLQAMAKLSQTLRDCDTWWVVAEEEAVDHGFWQGKQTRFAGKGGLGDRLHHTYSSLLAQYGRVILLGADAPQLTANHIYNAINALQRHPVAIGPAADGGFTLFAGKKTITKETWIQTPYSHASTLKILTQKLENYHLLSPLTDVDEVNDLKALYREMPEHPTAEQCAISEWIEQEKFS